MKQCDNNKGRDSVKWWVEDKHKGTGGTKGYEDRGRINGAISSIQLIVTIESSFKRTGERKARCPGI